MVRLTSACLYPDLHQPDRFFTDQRFLCLPAVLHNRHFPDIPGIRNDQIFRLWCARAGPGAGGRDRLFLEKAAVYEHENFDDSGTFSRSFPVSDAGSCEAARRALLSQGYIITSSGANQVVGNKSFQQNSENHLQISFNVTCAPDVSDDQRSTMFANALQDRYALKSPTPPPAWVWGCWVRCQCRSAPVTTRWSRWPVRR